MLLHHFERQLRLPVCLPGCQWARRHVVEAQTTHELILGVGVEPLGRLGAAADFFLEGFDRLGLKLRPPAVLVDLKRHGHLEGGPTSTWPVRVSITR